MLTPDFDLQVTHKGLGCRVWLSTGQLSLTQPSVSSVVPPNNSGWRSIVFSSTLATLAASAMQQQSRQLLAVVRGSSEHCDLSPGPCTCLDSSATRRVSFTMHAFLSPPAPKDGSTFDSLVVKSCFTVTQPSALPQYRLPEAGTPLPTECECA